MKRDKKLKKFCRKCGAMLIYRGMGEYSDLGVTFNRATGKEELAEIYDCSGRRGFWGNDLHDEFRVLNGKGYYYF